MLDAVAEKIKEHWGFGAFRPLQREAIECVLAGRDSLMVAPTGGGKSLCYQAPAAALPGTALVVSPLLSLMKDQVDALRECGVAAARIDSSQGWDEQQEVFARARAGRFKILYLSPERLMAEGFAERLAALEISFVAIDEAHCVSMWGHDFRPEYRMLGGLRAALPGRAVHAFTATATEQVRHDIVAGLKLNDAAVLVGSADRPNLTYGVRRREKRFEQITAILERWRGQSGIIYCLSRREVDELAETLRAAGWRAVAYHAGMESAARQQAQDDFQRDRADIVVATIAFGMGIDKSNVRFVIHATMPKSIEHYQQESGRAGRDGLPAECTLLWSARDYGTWKQIVEQQEGEARTVGLQQLAAIYQYCNLAACRRRSLLGHFAETYPRDNCASCDACLGELEKLEAGEALVLAQKILSCVVRLGERFGGQYTATVLEGTREPRILENHHDELSTYGLLKDFPRREIREFIDQLVAQQCLVTQSEYGTLGVTAKGWGVLRGAAEVQLFRPDPRVEEKQRRKRGAKAAVKPAEAGSDDDVLFERLRALRRKLADEHEVAAFIIFSDAALRDMAARRPAHKDEFLEVSGVGQRKCEAYGEIFMAEIRTHLVEQKPALSRS